jgi:uncharacterized protein involved in exopolysaccharide biosynthesis
VSAATDDLYSEDMIDLRALAARLWSRRRWIFASVIVCTAASSAGAFLMTPIYRATTVFVPASISRPSVSSLLGGALGSLGDLASIAGLNVGSGAPETEEALALLKSRQYTEAFIADRNLTPEFFPSRWDARNRRWKVGTVPPTPAQAYKYFNDEVRSVIEDKKTGLITLQIDWRDRMEAAQWANELLMGLNTLARTRAIERADASVGYLEKELNTTSVIATRDAINRLIEAQIKQRMLANVTEEYAFRVVDRAMAPDKTDVFKPKKLVMIAAGFGLGVLLGAAAALFTDSMSRKRVVRKAGI